MRAASIVLAVIALNGCAEDDGEPPTDGQPAGADLDDEFDADLSAWEVLHPDQAVTRVEGGHLLVEPVARSLWFNERAGVLVYQGVEGDFIATAHVSARRVSDPALPPAVPYRLGGIMARAPGGDGGENYVFIVVGADGDDLSIETKSTTNGMSRFEGPMFPAAEGDLRLCRVGASFRLLSRESESAPWMERASFDRPDLPDVLQVGPTGYANAPDPDLRVSFDFVRFGRPDGADACVE